MNMNSSAADSSSSIYYSFRDSDASFDPEKDESTLEAHEVSDYDVTRFEKTLQKSRRGKTPLLNSALVRASLLAHQTPSSKTLIQASTPFTANKENKIPNELEKVSFVLALKSDEVSPIGLNGTRIEETKDATIISTSGMTWQEIKENAKSPTELLLAKMGAEMSDLNLEEPPFSGRPSLCSMDFEVMIPHSKINQTPGAISLTSSDSDSVEIVSSFDEESEAQKGAADCFENKVLAMERGKIEEVVAVIPEKPKRQSLLPKKTTISSKFRGKIPLPAPLLPQANANRGNLTKKPPVPVPHKPIVRRTMLPLRATVSQDAPVFAPSAVTTKNRRSLHPATFKVISNQPNRRLSGIKASPNVTPRLSIGFRKSISSRKPVLPSQLSLRRTMLPSSGAIPKSSAACPSKPETKCSYCDKKFALSNVLETHLREKCTKIPAQVKKALMEKYINARELQLNRSKSRQESLEGECTRAPRQNVWKVAANSGLRRTPSKMIECKDCKLKFGDAVSYGIHVSSHANK